MDPAQIIACFCIATIAGFAGYYLPLHFNALLSLLAYGITDAALASVFVFCLTFSCIACSLLSCKERNAPGLEYSIAGGYAASALGVPLLFLVVPTIYSAARPFLWLVLGLLCGLLVVRDKVPKAAAVTMASSGALGFLVLFFSLCDNPLLALFSGFYGFSEDRQVAPANEASGLLVLFVPFIGMMLVMLPAATPFLAQPVLSAALPLVGPSQSAALVVGKTLYDLCSAFAIGKARSQGSAMVADSGADLQAVFLGILLGFLSLLAAMAFCRGAPKLGRKAQTAVTIVGKTALACLVLFSCGAWGMVIAIAAASISEYAATSGTSRGMCLGSLYLPAIAYPLGLTPILAKIALGY